MRKSGKGSNIQKTSQKKKGALVPFVCSRNRKKGGCERHRKGEDLRLSSGKFFI